MGDAKFQMNHVFSSGRGKPEEVIGGFGSSDGKHLGRGYSCSGVADAPVCRRAKSSEVTPHIMISHVGRKVVALRDCGAKVVFRRRRGACFLLFPANSARCEFSCVT